MMKKWLAVLGLLVWAGSVQADSTISLDFNDEAFRLGYHSRLEGTQLGGLEGGGTWLHDEDDGDLVTGDLRVVGNAGTRRHRLMVRVGGRGLFIRSDDLNESGFAIAPGGRVTFTPQNLNRLGLSGYVHFAPDVLSFSEAHQYLEYGVEVSYEVIRQAELYVGYREVQGDFDSANNVEIEENAHLGMRIRF